jgi:hypothetical protein
VTAATETSGPGVDPFRHEALLYRGDGEFVAAVSAFIRDGIAAREPTLVVVDARKIRLLREELGRDGEAVHFADMATVGHNPARIIPAWRRFVERHASAGARLRGVGEPISRRRGPDELVECQRHESLLNLAFADSTSFWLVCPYDVDALPAEVIDEARRSHPLVTGLDSNESSVAYRGLDAIRAPFTAPLPAPPREVAELKLGPSAIDAVPRAVAEYSAAAGVRTQRRIDFVVAVSELVKRSSEGGGAPVTVRLWKERGRVVCELEDGSEFDDPLSDRQLPLDGNGRGFGLWLANQLCDLVQVRTLPGRTIVRLHLAVD